MEGSTCSLHLKFWVVYQSHFAGSILRIAMPMDSLSSILTSTCLGDLPWVWSWIFCIHSKCCKTGSLVYSTSRWSLMQCWYSRCASGFVGRWMWHSFQRQLSRSCFVDQVAPSTPTQHNWNLAQCSSNSSRFLGIPISLSTRDHLQGSQNNPAESHTSWYVWWECFDTFKPSSLSSCIPLKYRVDILWSRLLLFIPVSSTPVWRRIES